MKDPGNNDILRREFSYVSFALRYFETSFCEQKKTTQYP